MFRVPEWVGVAEYRDHVSGAEPQGSRREIPAPDPDEWRDPVTEGDDG